MKAAGLLLLVDRDSHQLVDVVVIVLAVNPGHTASKRSTPRQQDLEHQASNTAEGLVLI